MVVNYFLENSIKIVDISCGMNHTAAIDDKGKVYMFGSNECGQLGLGKKRGTRKIPAPIESFQDGKMINVSCGTEHTLFLFERDVGTLFYHIFIAGGENRETPIMLAGSPRIKNLQLGTGHGGFLL